MAKHDIVVIGASLGGVDALAQLVGGLPADLPAAVFVVLHMQSDSTSHLPEILSHAGPLPAVHASDGDVIEHGRIYVAPPDRHLLLKHGYLRVVRGPRENRNRPALDPLFRTAARAYGPRVVGVVLTGRLDDGTAGLDAVKMRGGVTIVQDPDDAHCAEMPLSALRQVTVDHCKPVAEIGSLLSALADQPADGEGAGPVSSDLALEADFAEMDTAVLQRSDPPGIPAGFTCPECRGPLWEQRDGKLLRFRCRVGHAYSTATMMADKAEAVESSLWAALVALQEKAAMARRLSAQTPQQSSPLLAARFADQVESLEQHIATLRQMLQDDNLFATG